MEMQLRLHKFEVSQKIFAKIRPSKMLGDLAKKSGLKDRSFLWEFYQEEFGAIGQVNYSFGDADRLRAYVGLMGLCMGRFWILDLPLSRTIRENTGDWTPESYQITSVPPWNDYDLLSWDSDFDQYIEDRKRFASGAGDDVPDADFSLRFELAEKYLEKLTERLRELLKPASDSVEVTERNRALRQLLAEMAEYPTTLKSFIWRGFEGLISDLKPKDAFGELCLKTLSSAVYGEGFDLEKFRRGVIEYYWNQLNALLKDESQKKILGIIKLEVSELIEPCG
ncbi:MAG: hypothetical protein KAU41_09590 [Deltaproteobacteria bacterium]|nr:hypothetical protein [Deltaproteobacteria bacterium]